MRAAKCGRADQASMRYRHPPRPPYDEAPTVHGQGFVGGGAGRRSPSPKNTTRNRSRKRLPKPRFRRLSGDCR